MGYLQIIPGAILSYAVLRYGAIPVHGQAFAVSRRLSGLTLFMIPITALMFFSAFEGKAPNGEILFHIALILLPLVLFGFLLMFLLTRPIAQKIDSSYQLLNQSHKDLGKAYVDLKQAQNKLIEAEKMSSLGVMVAGVAHEINNPLNAVTTQNYNLKVHLEKKQNEINQDFSLGLKMLRDQEFASERIMEIVMSLRQFARPDREEKELVDISEVIKSSVTITRSRTKKVKIENQLKSKLEFLVFPGKLAQIVGNLLVNAADALENIENPRINIISSLNFDGELEILVCDNGPGISKEIQNKIFDPFFTTKDVGKGTGLGLSLCKKFIEEMGGSLKLKTEPGETIFIITLPKV